MNKKNYHASCFLNAECDELANTSYVSSYPSEIVQSVSHRGKASDLIPESDRFSL